MADEGAFGFGADDFDWVIREAGEGLRAAFDRFSRAFSDSGDRAGWGGLLADVARMARSGPPTAGETGDGVWAIYTVDDDGAAQVEQVYATELDALRAAQRSPDPNRRVRFLPYGIAVSVLDATSDDSGAN